MSAAAHSTAAPNSSAPAGAGRTCPAPRRRRVRGAGASRCRRRQAARASSRQSGVGRPVVGHPTRKVGRSSRSDPFTSSMRSRERVGAGLEPIGLLDVDAALAAREAQRERVDRLDLVGREAQVAARRSRRGREERRRHGPDRRRRAPRGGRPGRYASSKSRSSQWARPPPRVVKPARTRSVSSVTTRSSAARCTGAAAVGAGALGAGGAASARGASGSASPAGAASRATPGGVSPGFLCGPRRTSRASARGTKERARARSYVPRGTSCGTGS